MEITVTGELDHTSGAGWYRLGVGLSKFRGMCAVNPSLIQMSLVMSLML